MSKFHGKDGNVQLDGEDVLHVTKWGLEIDKDYAESTPMRDGIGFKDFKSGDIGWIAAVDCYTDDSLSNYFFSGLTADSIFAISLEFENTGITFIGAAKLVKINNDVNVKAPATHQLVFLGVLDENGDGPEVI